jgi:hypothetical protein
LGAEALWRLPAASQAVCRQKETPENPLAAGAPFFGREILKVFATVSF